MESVQEDWYLISGMPAKANAAGSLGVLQRQQAKIQHIQNAWRYDRSEMQTWCWYMPRCRLTPSSGIFQILERWFCKNLVLGKQDMVVLALGDLSRMETSRAEYFTSLGLGRFCRLWWRPTLGAWHGSTKVYAKAGRDLFLCKKE